MKKTYIFLTLILAVLVSCHKTEVAQFQDKAVVEGYLFAGRVPVITISKQIPFTSDAEFSTEDIDKLTIHITQESTGKVYTLSSLGEGKYTDLSLIPVVGETYKLSFIYNGEQVEATTTIPSKPYKAKLSQTSVTVYKKGEIGMGGGPMGDIKVIWSNNDNSYYIVVVENMETSPTPVFDEDDYEDGEDMPSMNFRSEPTTGDTVKINSMTFQYYGRHRVLLNKIQPEYALLYTKNSNSSQSLSEVHANVKNGFGIFTGINTDTLYLRVSMP